MSPKQLNIHIKILTRPKAPRTVRRMISAMRQVFNSANIDVQLASKQVFNLKKNPDLAALNVLDVGTCSGNATDEQIEIAQHRNSVPDRQIVIYVCQSLTDAFAGCAVHADDSKPMAVISAKNATYYTMAHEVGHLLGLEHPAVEDPDQLMDPGGHKDLHPLPFLVESEIDKMRNSPFLI